MKYLSTKFRELHQLQAEYQKAPFSWQEWREMGLAVCWNLYGYFFCHHYLRFRFWVSRAKRRLLMTRHFWELDLWCLTHLKRGLCLYRWLTGVWHMPTCMHCGYDFDLYRKPYFICEESDVSYIPGEPDVHWFRGIQYCPRCIEKWEVEDSD
jgi:hypothetical protein